MKYPIRLYGDPVLRALTQDVETNSEELQQLIADMHETLQGASGIGLAAPQIGRSERLFLVDLTVLLEEDEYDIDLPEQPMIFINPEIIWEAEEEIEFEEGCLSIPDIQEVVIRPESIRITYRDQHFVPQEIQVKGVLARVIQHEYDHLEGVLFIDIIRPFRRSLLRRRLREITRGNVETDYPVAIGKKISA